MLIAWATQVKVAVEMAASLIRRYTVIALEACWLVDSVLGVMSAVS